MKWTWCVVLLTAAVAPAQPKRPPIVGVSHVTVKTDNLAEERKLFSHDFGFSEAFQAASATCFKVNDHQYIQVMPGLKDDSEDRLSHVAFETANVRQMRDYLASKGVTVPETATLNAEGDLSLMVHDPEGRAIEFVEYTPESLTSRNFGKLLGAERISERIIHAGFIVQDQAAENRFYRDILNFKETWHGGMTDTRTEWVDMRVPEGTDWLEYMLNQPHPSVKTRGVMNHLALGVPSVAKGYDALLARGANLKTEKPKIGRDGKWQLNLYDVNFTRVELMEFKAVEPPCCSPFVN